MPKVETDKLTVTINESHQLVVYFKPNSADIQYVELTHDDVPLSDIVDWATQTKDIRFLVLEIHARLYNFASRRKEILQLGERYTVREISKASCVTALLPSGETVTLTMEIDYPRPYSRVRIDKIEGCDQLRAQKVMEELNTNSSVSLSNTLQQIESLLN